MTRKTQQAQCDMMQHDISRMRITISRLRDEAPHAPALVSIHARLRTASSRCNDGDFTAALGSYNACQRALSAYNARKTIIEYSNDAIDESLRTKVITLCSHSTFR